MKEINSSRIGKSVRTILGILFISTGVMKFAIPDLRAAFSGQLIAGGIPFHSINTWVVPFVEIGLGVLFIRRLLLRFAALSAVVHMAVATYVHLVADNPALFPLQPELPVIPVAVVLLSISLLLMQRGSSSLSFPSGERPAADDINKRCTGSCACGAIPHVL